MPLTLKKVSYSYHPGTPLQTDALRDVSLILEPGEFAALLGPAGCGKSTLLLLAGNLLTPSHGSVTCDGTIGMVFQNPDHQLFETTLEREIAFAPTCQGLDEAAVKARVDAALCAVHLDRPELRERSPFTLSGGEKRRAVLAGVLAMEPRYLLLDEPLAGLDAEGTEILLDCLHERCRNGAAVLMASHDPDLVCEHASRVIRMDGGRIIFDGSVQDGFTPADPSAADLPEYGSVRETVSRLRQAGFRLPDGITRFSELTAALRSELLRRRSNV